MGVQIIVSGFVHIVPGKHFHNTVLLLDILLPKMELLVWRFPTLLFQIPQDVIIWLVGAIVSQLTALGLGINFPVPIPGCLHHGQPDFQVL